MTRIRDAIGQRRHRLTLFMPVETANALGGAKITWQAGLSFWGRIEALSGSETIEGAQLGSKISTRITLRWRAGVTARQRLGQGARIFAIRAVFDPDGFKRQLICLCEELAP
jgi:SPP1 family predicted phage head-tail adaptor